MGSKNEIITFDLRDQKVVDAFKITQDPNEAVYDIKALPTIMTHRQNPSKIASSNPQASGVRLYQNMATRSVCRLRAGLPQR